MSTAAHEFKRLTALATPVVITQVTSMLMGVVDIIMVGHVGVDELGGVSLGRLWLFGTILFGMGILFGLDPLFSQAHGRRDGRSLGITLQRGVLLALVLSIPMAVAWAFTGDMLLLLRQKEDLARLAQAYAVVQIPGIPAIMLFAVLRGYLQGRAIMRPAMWTAIVANLVNVLFNWVLIYGHLGFPALGVQGAGIATTLTRFFMVLTLLGVILKLKLHHGAWVPWSRSAFRLAGLREIAYYGLPVGVQLGLEVWAFEIATLMAGRLTKVDLAAHTIALNLASFSFMVPLGVALAAVTRVGNLIGERRQREAQTAAWVAFAMGAGTMAVSALGFVLLRHLLPRVYTTELPVIAATAAILPIAAAFQIFDGTQVVGSGILRGMGRTRPAAAFNLVGYYLLALPAAWWLTFHQGMGLAGIWWGLSLGLASVALMLVAWVAYRGPLHAVPIVDSNQLAGD